MLTKLNTPYLGLFTAGLFTWLCHCSHVKPMVYTVHQALELHRLQTAELHGKMTTEEKRQALRRLGWAE